MLHAVTLKGGSGLGTRLVHSPVHESREVQSPHRPLEKRVGAKHGLWTLDWTHGLDCGLRFGPTFGPSR